MQNCSRRSNLELRRPRSGLKVAPRSSRGVRSAHVFAQIPNPEAARTSNSRELGVSRTSNSGIPE
eukprot:15383603-Alexandrium_andersonii.AAC.1